MSTSRVASLGEYLREQRRGAELSLRELAREAGVSNPYLSQVERGLRRPSAEVLYKIAAALQISAEHLFVQAGLLEEGTDAATTTEAVINADPALTPRQRRSLLDIYAAFRAQNDASAPAVPSDLDDLDEPDDLDDPDDPDDLLVGLDVDDSAAAIDPSTPVPAGTPT